jgi:hypothetical protein
MLVCERCGEAFSPDDILCMNCGRDLSLKAEWTREVAEANNIHWLAQCQRRLFSPIDESEEVPFVAFEYGWKALNRLYNQLSIPKVVTEDGKVRERNAKECLLYMFEHYGVTQQITVENLTSIKSLCDCVLEISDVGFLSGKRGHLTFDDESEAEASDLRASAIGKCSALITATEKDDYGRAVSALVESLLAVRNARVHASYRVPSKLPAGGESDSVVRRSRKKDGDQPLLASIHRHDYEVHTVAEIVLAIGKIVIVAKTKQPFDYIEQLVDSRTGQIRRQIAEKVRAWPLAAG